MVQGHINNKVATTSITKENSAVSPALQLWLPGAAPVVCADVEDGCDCGFDVGVVPDPPPPPLRE